MNKYVFREYDVRGVVERDFKPNFVYKLGKAYGTFLRENNSKIVSLSGDIRHSTEELKKNLIKGFLDVGVDVYDMGTLPTPVNYFSLYTTKIPNSIQITGSHNPKEYNGFKISYNKKPFFGENIQYLYQIINKEKYFNANNLGKKYSINILNEYISFVKQNIKIEKKLKCIIDCGNSVGGLVAPSLFKSFGLDVKELFCDIDGDFPNHHPDPTVDDNLIDIISEIKKGDYDVGIAYDGDADRIVAIDNKGNIVRSDILMAIFVSQLVKENDSIIYDVKCSKALEMTIIENKGIPIMWKTGHSLIKSKMIQSKSKFGGEMSGHIFFADKYFGFDDGVYVSLRLIELLSQTGKSLSELVENIPKFVSSPEIRIDCDNDDIKFKVVDKVKNFFIKNKYECNLIDGVRIEFEYGWGLLRASNTQPVIVCRFEADNNKNLNKIKNLIVTTINSFGDIKVEL